MFQRCPEIELLGLVVLYYFLFCFLFFVFFATALPVLRLIAETMVL